MEQSPARTFQYRDLYRHPRQPDNSIISDGLLKRCAMMVVGGPAKAYKSFVLNSLAVSLCTGRNLFGAYRSDHGRALPMFTIDRPHRVLYFEQELGEDDLDERLAPQYDALDPHEQELMRTNLYTRSFDPAIRFDTAEGMKALDAVVRDVTPDIVIFDPLIEFHQQEENSNTAMSIMLKNLMSLCRSHSLTVILSHHEGRDNGQSNREGAERLRGASAVFGKGDSFLSLSVRHKTTRMIQIDFTLRRAKPVRSLLVRIDALDLHAKFQCWQGDKRWNEILKKADIREETDDDWNDVKSPTKFTQ